MQEINQLLLVNEHLKGITDLFIETLISSMVLFRNFFSAQKDIDKMVLNVYL